MNTVSFWRLGHQTAISLCLGSSTASGWCVVVVSTGCWQQHLEHRSSDGASACGATEPCRLARHNLRLTSLVPPVASLHKDSRKLDKVLITRDPLDSNSYLPGVLIIRPTGLECVTISDTSPKPGLLGPDLLSHWQKQTNKTKNNKQKTSSLKGCSQEKVISNSLMGQANRLISSRSEQQDLDQAARFVDGNPFCFSDAPAVRLRLCHCPASAAPFCRWKFLSYSVPQPYSVK